MLPGNALDQVSQHGATRQPLWHHQPQPGRFQPVGSPVEIEKNSPTNPAMLKNRRELGGLMQPVLGAEALGLRHRDDRIGGQTLRR